MKFLAMGKEEYYKSLKVLRVITIHLEVRKILAIKTYWVFLLFKGGLMCSCTLRNQFMIEKCLNFILTCRFLIKMIVSSSAKGVGIVFYKMKLGEILRRPCVGLADYTWTKKNNCALTTKLIREGLRFIQERCLKVRCHNLTNSCLI